MNYNFICMCLCWCAYTCVLLRLVVHLYHCVPVGLLEEPGVKVLAFHTVSCSVM